MIKKSILITFFVCNVAFGHCIFITCVPSVNMATASTTNALEREFINIDNLLGEIDKAYHLQNKVLSDNNKIREKILKLKKEYLILLKNINFELSKQKDIR